jgi:predicted transcriptional regulator
MATQLPIRMSDELRAALKARAEKERRTEAAVARLILEDALLDTQPIWSHTFTPKQANALRCSDCGGRKVDHP